MTHIRTMELLKVVMLVGAFVHITMALFIEGGQNRYEYYLLLVIKVNFEHELIACVKIGRLKY